MFSGADATRIDMDRKLREFKDVLATNDVGLSFFAGHGMQIDGTNYLLATDTDTSSELDAKHSSLSLDKVIDTMAKSQASMKIMILDACRNNPWERAWHRDASTRGLASVYAPKGTIIGFATSAGEVAERGRRPQRHLYRRTPAAHRHARLLDRDDVQAGAEHRGGRNTRKTDILGAHLALGRVLFQHEPWPRHPGI